MQQFKMLLAFGLGCLTALMLGFGPDLPSSLSVSSVIAGTNPDILERRLSVLEERAADLEQNAANGQVGNRVVAPFEVVDGAKRRIFFVNDNVTLLFGKQIEAEISPGGPSGGYFGATSASGKLEVKLGAASAATLWGLSLREDYNDRIGLGKDTKAGNHHLSFLSAGGQLLAGIGEDRIARRALVHVYDKQGRLRASMTVAPDSKGVVGVWGGNAVPLVQLGESGSGGGRLWIGNAGGVGMAEAGDAGGYGIVRAGPEGFKFIPTPGLALPGNVIVGKR
jgi:hypothetical protein